MMFKMCIHIEGFYKARVYRWQLKQIVKTELVAINTQLTVSLGQALRVFRLLGQASKQTGKQPYIASISATSSLLHNLKWKSGLHISPLIRLFFNQITDMSCPHA